MTPSQPGLLPPEPWKSFMAADASRLRVAIAALRKIKRIRRPEDEEHEIATRALKIIEIPKPPAPKKERLSPYLRWVGGLKYHSKVRVVMPWSDGEIVGGHVSPGTVVSVRERGVYVAYRGPKGNSLSEFFYFKSGASGPYGYLVPVDRDVVNDPRRGNRFCKLGSRLGHRRGS